MAWVHGAGQRFGIISVHGEILGVLLRLWREKGKLPFGVQEGKARSYTVMLCCVQCSTQKVLDQLDYM